MTNYAEITQQANAALSILSWEPVIGTGECLNVAVLYQFEGQIKNRLLIREDVLRCMYGQAGEGAYKMIQVALNSCTAVGQKFGLDAALASVPLSNFFLSKVRPALATDEQDLLRQIVLMNCSLSTLADEMAPSADDQPTSEQEVNKQWTTRIKEAIQVLQPDMLTYFNREAILVDHGVPVRFGVLSPKLAAHFGLLKPNQQNQGMEDARAKMWKLSLAKERNNALNVALIYGTPKDDDITLSDKQHERLAANVKELGQEAVDRGISAQRVYTVAEAANKVIELV